MGIYLSKIIIRNFRQISDLNLDLQPGLNLIVGENDSGKSTLIDAIRLLLGTRDNERLWLNEKDFNFNGTDYASEITIEGTFKGFDDNQAAPFLEWIAVDDKNKYSLKVKFTAKRLEQNSAKYGRKFTVDVTAGPDKKGSQMDGMARDLLKATYLKPLRDAGNELKAKRGSRLSQILSSHPDLNIKTEKGKLEKKRVEALISELNDKITKDDSVYKSREDELNKKYFNEFLFEGEGEKSSATIKISSTDLNDILEKMELYIDEHRPPGLGINNLLFMATELLLLKPEENGYDLPLLLIEEPEAHIHPQYQLNLINYFKKQSDVQVLMTTHSPNLASAIDLENLIIMKNGNAFPMGHKYTKLCENDYAFLERFLDVTKANMFFAKGIIFVEGPSEEILLPYIAEKIGKPLHKYGVSIINVGHKGLFRYANIFKRQDDKDCDIKIACVTDLDVPPKEAEEYLNRKNDGYGSLTVPTTKDFTPEQLLAKEEQEKAKFRPIAETYLASPWTLEFSLAESKLAEILHIAILIANSTAKNKYSAKFKQAREEYKEWLKSGLNERQIASNIFKNIYTSNVSKPEIAQILVDLLNKTTTNNSKECFRKLFPKYLIDAIDNVTSNTKTNDEENIAEGQS